MLVSKPITELRVAYVMRELLYGSPPWGDCDDVDGLILHKTNIMAEELFDGRPVEFSEYLTYVKSPVIDEEPRYRFLRKAFRD
jgi:hypothetical protein